MWLLAPPTILHPPLACRARSDEHCKISRSDEDQGVYLYDLSSNGTYINGILIGNGNRELLRNGDTITLLDPANPNHYQFLFQDLRPQPPPPPPPPPLPLHGHSAEYPFCGECSPAPPAASKTVLWRWRSRQLATHDRTRPLSHLLYTASVRGCTLARTNCIRPE